MDMYRKCMENVWKLHGNVGKHVWENVVSACRTCNHNKAEKTPGEAQMTLLRKPLAPKPNPYYIFYHRKLEDEWSPFIPWKN